MTSDSEGAPPPTLEAGPPTDRPPARVDAPLRWWRSTRHIQLALLLLGCATIVAVNLYLIQSAPPRAITPPGPSAVVASAAATPREQGTADRPAPPVATSDPVSAGPLDPAPHVDEPPRNDEPPQSEAPERKDHRTVEWAANRACSTAHINGLSRQIVAEARCIDANAFASVPARRNLESAGHVFLYLDAPARDHLLRVLDAHPKRVMKVHSALRTVAQQYLLSRWAARKRCGIQLATPPGASNHETGLALDISSPGTWRSALEREGFRWLGSIDRVHFDFVGPGAKHHHGLDVQAFQRLWNRNHPGDTIAETGRYDVATEVRLKRSPAGGFRVGARCGRGRSGRNASSGGLPGGRAR